jgi:eukaryotic-like serine/threonine-protein kinase
VREVARLKKIGMRLGTDLTVLGVIDGRGGVPIYLVWHHKHWCSMACKVFKNSDKARREAEILSTLAHPNIVRCFGVSQSTCMLMEFLEGPTLHRFIKTQPKSRLAISDAIRVAVHIGSALKHIHDTGLLHLDVKPSNIIVMNGRPVLYDFGIARWQGAPRPNAIRGTESYIAPEECLLQSVTPAADIFGLGVTLYQILTGDYPFPEGSRSKPYPQVSQAPVPVRHRRPSVPPALDRLILSCLTRDPPARPNLAELLSALHAFISTGPHMWPAGFRPKM